MTTQPKTATYHSVNGNFSLRVVNIRPFPKAKSFFGDLKFYRDRQADDKITSATGKPFFAHPALMGLRGQLTSEG